MSLGITVLTHDTVVITSDSAASANIKNKMFRVNDNVSKLIILDKNTVAFISGDCDLSKLIMDDLSLNWIKTPTVEYIQETIKFWSDKYFQIRPEAEQLRKRDNRLSNATVVAQFKKNKAYLHTFSEKTNFELQTFTVKQHQHMIQAHGIKVEEAGKAIAEQLDKKLSVYEAIINTYNSTSSEEVGGTLEGYIINRKGVKPFVRKKILEKSDLIRFDIDVYKNTEIYKQKILVHNTIQGSSMVIGENDDILKMFPDQGVWLGDKNFSKAPFSVDLQGNMIARKAKLIGAAGEILFDTETGKINIGKMNIEGVGRLDAQYIQTGTITAKDGFINDLTVTALKTLDKSDEIGDSVDYVSAKENYIKFSTGTITDRQHAKNSINELLYWTDSTKSNITTDATAYPVYELEYNPVDKMAIELVGEGMSSHPKITMGAGDGHTSTSGKAVIEKPEGSLDITYHRSNTGAVRALTLDNVGITIKAEANGTVTIEGSNINITATDRIKFNAGEYEFL